MSYQDIRNTREGFVDMGAGDKLIKVESKILAFVAFLVMLAYFKTGFGTAIVISVIIGFIFPWLIGLVEVFAWIAAIGFSIIWAGIGYFIVGAIGGDSVILGLIGAVIIFIICFYLHKIFSGLGYSSLTKIALDTWDEAAANTSETNKILNSMNTSNVKFCVKCGTKLNCDAAFCAKCGSPQ